MCDEVNFEGRRVEGPTEFFSPFRGWRKPFSADGGRRSGRVVTLRRGRSCVGRWGGVQMVPRGVGVLEVRIAASCVVGTLLLYWKII